MLERVEMSGERGAAAEAQRAQLATRRRRVGIVAAADDNRRCARVSLALLMSGERRHRRKCRRAARATVRDAKTVRKLVRSKLLVVLEDERATRATMPIDVAGRVFCASKIRSLRRRLSMLKTVFEFASF